MNRRLLGCAISLTFYDGKDFPYMHHLTRRKFLTMLAGAGATGLGGPFWLHEAAFAAVDAGHQTAPVPASAALPAGQFTNRLRLPGASGLYAAVAAKDVKQITVSELNFEVLPRISSPFWAYVAEVGGRQLLNPTLLARSGDQIRLRMVNRLKQPTIIHWHGLTNDDRNDGTGMYVAAPGKDYDYAFTVRDRAANYWYHPHPHDITGEQVYKGLAGLLIVKDDDEEKLASALDLAVGVTDIPLVIQDRSFNFEGKLEYKLSRDQTFAGFLGEEILVNLTARPYFDAARRIYRFRILNGSNARTYRLAFAQGSRPIEYYLIGTDGGLLPQDTGLLDTVLVWPGESVRIALDFGHPFSGDQTYMFHCHNLEHQDRGMMIGYKVKA